MLREHKLRSGYSHPHEPVFAGLTGRPLAFRNVERRGMDAAAEKLDGNGRRPTMHDLRHTFASLLIAQGLDVVYISRQLGHKDPATTLRVYASEFDKVRHADAARALLSEQFGNLVETAARNQPQDGAAEMAVVSQIRN
jgi:integrase